MIKSELTENIKNLNSAHIKLGLKGYAGNKGAICIRFDYNNSSVCVINCHFAAFKSKVKKRNEQVKAVLEQCEFWVKKKKIRIHEHDFVFWAGDFNYRVEGIPSEKL